MAASSVDQAVLNLFSQNKPFSLQNLVDLLAHAGFKKAAITKSVDSLVEHGKISAKEFGKTKLFMPPQAGLAVLSKEEMAEKRAATKAAQDALREERDAVKAAEAELTSWRTSLTAEQMQAEAAALTSKLADLQRRLEPLKTGAVLVSAADKAAAEKALATNLEHWRKRRSIFKNIWSTMSESIEGRKEAEVFEEMGVDTDEAVGADLKGLEGLAGAKRRRF
ncbi:uncharacterized protein HaLaN_17524 [Haematococcus lacustris]|uniref:Homologous-pairing protein 2 homolog n=2 Tax=Haematococcus lacustris TaxID=44745 RepID=A0A699ZWU7_HAELA|nr:uncharacterized protein HaLaN_17524 [Haematococcus lacustris]